MPDFGSILDDAGRSTTEPTLRLGRLPSPAHGSALRNLLSNLKDFLTERPVKIPGNSTAFAIPAFGASLGENLKEFFRAGPRGPANSALLVNWDQGFGGFWQNLRDLIFPRKLPPLKTTSQPVLVPEIWTKDTQFTRVQALSVALHVAVLVLLIVPLLPELMSPPTTQAKSNVTPLEVSEYLPKLAPGAKKAGGGGGGGEHNPVPASKGRLPKFSWTQFTPPKVKPLENPKLAMTPTVLGPPEIRTPNMNSPNWGDPLQKVLSDSNGAGGGNGIGAGNGTGVGSGSGAGVGPGDQWGVGGGHPAGRDGYGWPECMYCPSPQFSDEAVKAKYQGTVIIIATITPDGRATDIHVAQGLGLGLNEKAMAAVRTWRFKPAIGPDGRPAVVTAPIEVTFHLY